ncbi:MAG: hypothetical protein JWQ66_2806 [Mucilaginibacter sp.]|nr:hypothetical protein [Mucilaginibacter sp.]
MISDRHAVMMHSIAQLAFFCYGLLILRCLMRTVFHLVLVGKYHYLPCCKTDQNDPGVNDMTLSSFQNSNCECITIIMPCLQK